MNQALAELKDIHLPAATPWWEFAPGWWLLLLMLTVSAVWLLPEMVRRYRLQRARKFLGRDIETNFQQIRSHYEQYKEIQPLLAELSIFLRRVCLTLFAAEQTAGLIGSEWLEFLDAKWLKPEEGRKFSEPEIAGLLTHGAYAHRGADDLETDVEKLLELTEQWLNMVLKHHV